MTSLIGRTASALCCIVACVGLAGCTPAGKAVGDTQEEEAAVAFDGLDRGDVVIGFIGSANDTDTDSELLQTFDDAGLEAVYVSTSTTADPAVAAQNGVQDMAFRQVSIIIVSQIDITDDTSQGWDDALDDARTAGIPVVMINPVRLPDDETLFAASFVVDDSDTEATPIDDAVMTVIDDKPHERTVIVTTDMGDA